MVTPNRILALQASVPRGPDRYEFGTADGVRSPDELPPAELALLGAIDPADDADVLVPDANYGVVGTVLGSLAAEGRTVCVTDSARACALCQHNLRDNGVSNAEAVQAPDLAAYHDTGIDVVAHAPPAYEPAEVVKHRLREGLAALAPGGSLYLAAGRNEGVRRYRDELVDYATSVDRVLKRSGVEVYRAERAEGRVDVGEIAETSFEATVAGETCSFVTRPGLFSAGHLDEGTRHLLESLDVEPGESVLDLACGWGPVACFVGRFGAGDVTATDDSAAAVAYAERNLDANEVDARVVSGDGVEAVRGATYDLVAANPPTHAGSGVTDDLFSGVADVLADGGRFALVYNDVLGYESRLARWFDAVDVVRAADGFHVTVARGPR